MMVLVPLGFRFIFFWMCYPLLPGIIPVSGIQVVLWVYHHEMIRICVDQKIKSQCLTVGLIYTIIQKPPRRITLISVVLCETFIYLEKNSGRIDS